MIRILRTGLISFMLLATILLGAPVPVALAASGCSWTGAIDGIWSKSGNWGAGCSGAGGIPGTGDSLTFPNGVAHLSMSNDLPAISLQTLTFSSNTGYTITGTNTISLTGGINVQSGTSTINAPLAILNSSVDFTIASTANITFGGTLNLGANILTVTVNNAAGVTGLSFNGVITGGPSQTHKGKIIKGGSGDMMFFGASETRLWDIDLNGGSISTSSLGGTYLPYTGIITLAAGTNLNLLAGAVIGSIAGAGTIHASSFFQVRENHDTTFTGDITGHNQFALIGDGHLTIDRSGGSLSYTGEINLNVGPSYLNLVNTTATSVSDFILNSSYENAVLELNNSHVGLIKLGYPDVTHLYSGTIVLSGTLPNSATQVVVQTEGCGIRSMINSATDYGKLIVTFPLNFGGHSFSFSLGGTFVPLPGSYFEILNNTGAGTIILNNAFFTGLGQAGSLVFNGQTLIADYHAAGDKAFSLTNSGRSIFLPLVVR
jgi:hypothetical protein